MNDFSVWATREARVLAKEIYDTHSSCITVRGCGLYYDIISEAKAALLKCRAYLEQPMRCGHPIIYWEGDSCRVCEKMKRDEPAKEGAFQK